MRNLFNKKINILRVSRVSDGLGGFTEDWTTLYSDIPARIQSSRSVNRTNTYLDKEELIADYFAFIPYYSNINEGDRVSFDSKLFEIRKIENPDETSRYLKLYLREVENA